MMRERKFVSTHLDLYQTYICSSYKKTSEMLSLLIACGSKQNSGVTVLPICPLFAGDTFHTSRILFGEILRSVSHDLNVARRSLFSDPGSILQYQQSNGMNDGERFTYHRTTPFLPQGFRGTESSSSTSPNRRGFSRIGRHLSVLYGISFSFMLCASKRFLSRSSPIMAVEMETAELILCQKKRDFSTAGMFRQRYSEWLHTVPARWVS